MQFEAQDQVLMQLCNRVAGDVGDGTTEERLIRYRAFLQSLTADEVHPTPFYQKWSYLAAAASVVLGLSLWSLWPRDDALRFWIGHERVAGVVGQRLSVPEDGVVPLMFEAGSDIVLQSGAVAQVVDANRNAVDIRLEDGTLVAIINGNGTTEWSIHAGPFRVVVVGTRFMVSWNPLTEVFDVKVEQGTVRIEGTRFADHGIKVTQGYHLRIDQRTDFLALNATGSAYYDPNEANLFASLRDNSLETVASNHIPGNTNAKRSGENRGEAEIAYLTTDGMLDSRHVFKENSTVGRKDARRRGYSNTKEEKTQTGTSKRSPVSQATARILSSENKSGDEALFLGANSADSKSQEGPAKPKWIQLFEKGEYRQALQEAEKIGIETLLINLDLDSLWNLMYAARSIGKERIAESALMACRKRFSGSEKAKIAPFILGKIYEEKTKNLTAAVVWFSTYLKETPKGPLVEEAEGRLMVVYDKLGKEKEAKSMALQYLQKHPRGLFSGKARSITKSE